MMVHDVEERQLKGPDRPFGALQYSNPPRLMPREVPRGLGGTPRAESKRGSNPGPGNSETRRGRLTTINGFYTWALDGSSPLEYRSRSRRTTAGPTRTVTFNSGDQYHRSECRRGRLGCWCSC
jgi:hypothetical protein